MRQSMTGFASEQGSGQGFGWIWEIRGVNGKGLDLRLRLPDWIEGLEPLVRKTAQARLARGNVQIGLRVAAEEGGAGLRLDAGQLAGVLDAMAVAETEAMDRGISLAPSTAAEVVAVRGVLTSEAGQVDQAALRTALMADFETALAGFVEMRGSEGQALQDVLARQLGEIETLTADAETAAKAREAAQTVRLQTQLARVIDNASDVDPQRVAQELALIAVKADVTEEIDRLRAHVAAARDLLGQSGPVGRKLDFLMQEFNREANTLCSKSGAADLTQIGLSLKTTIDQMREQVQNVE
ncbi:MAG: YicC/YloC family endoribonuclease [Paracoccaceae bacterium]|nr:YicC/YloC family endoribonuclease [Paracoccaceae bacterium]